MHSKKLLEQGVRLDKTSRFRPRGWQPSHNQNAATLKARLALTSKDLRDPFLRTTQKRWDMLYFNQRYALEEKGVCFVDAKVDHIGKHISNLLQRIRNLELYPNDPHANVQVRDAALPDAGIYRTQLANTLSFNLQTQLGSVTTNSSSLHEAKDLVIDALPFYYTEPLEHLHMRDAEQRKRVRHESIPALHMAQLILANHFDIDPHHAHLQRLARNAELPIE